LRPVIEQVVLSFRKHVVLPGYVSYSELPGFYGIADVFVHPAVGEPWGVSVNEAMACGIPVLAAEGVGAGKDLITEGRTGTIFPDGNETELGRQLVYYASHPQVLAEMSREIRTKVGHWSYQQTLSELTRALQG